MHSYCPPYLSLQNIKKESGAASLVGQAQKLKVEAERLDVMDKAAGVLAELLFDEKILQQIKDYRTLFLVVCGCACVCVCVCVGVRTL